MRLIILFFAFPVLSALGFSSTICVPSDYPYIQEAIDAAFFGDTIMVALGTYIENIDFIGKTITVKSSGGPSVTIIDGHHAGSVVVFSNGEDRGSVLDEILPNFWTRV